MKKGTVILLVLLGGFFIVGCTSITFVVGKYNSLVGKRETVDSSWSQVENVYQRRYDLIPNLVETVKGYAAHEKETFIAVTEARAKVGQIKIDANQLAGGNFAEQFKQFQQAQGELSSALSRLMVVVEKYPELKADELFYNLMKQLEGTENRITVERMRYNDSARDYNAYKKRFPAVLVAGFFQFDDRPYFKAEDGASKAPKVNFGTSR